MSRAWLVPLFALALSAPPARAQDSVRDLTGAGQQNKFLTPNQLDRWLFEGEKGETVIAHVASREFDPILGLAPAGAETKALLEVDDPGSESRFAARLPEAGRYEIRVHAFKFQGGGNYTLRVQRFRATPLAVGERLVGTFDREGKGYHFFPGSKDRLLVPEVRGAPPDSWTALDFKGREVKGWAGTVPVEGDGEGYLIVSGHPGQRYELLVREARRRALPDGREGGRGALDQGEADVWSFPGKPGDFRLFEVEKTGDVQARLLFAPPEEGVGQRLGRPGERPEVVFLPVASRGGRLRFAAVLGREGRYQLQVVATSPAAYTLTARDPSEPIGPGREVEGNLPVGGAAFYRFEANPGQLIQAALATQRFVPVLRLYDAGGSLVAASGDDAAADSTGRITYMVTGAGTYRLQVASAGDGGGGEFRQALREARAEGLRVGERARGTLPPGATDFRAFEGREGQTVFLSVRSSAFEPAVSVRGPGGVLLAADDRGSPAAGSLLAVRLPQTGRYTVWISSRRGAGEYTARLIDGD